MFTTKLIPYTVQMRPNGEASEADLWNVADLQQYNPTVQSQLGQSNDIVDLSNINTFSDLFRSFCQYYESDLKDVGEEVDWLQNVTFGLSSDWEPNSDWEPPEKIVEGTLYIGNYGVRRTLADRQSGDRRDQGRDFDDAEEKPLYFLMYTPVENTTQAYLLLERSQRYGAKDPFYATLQRWIRKNYSDKINVTIDPVKTSEIFPKMREADRTVRLRLEKDGTPDLVHEDFNPVFGHQEMKQTTEFRPKAGEDMDLIVDELKEWHNDPRRSFETIDNVAYNNVKITIEKNGSKETISLTKDEVKLRKNIDLSNTVEKGDIPPLTEISSQAHEFISTITGDDTTSSLFK